jgi:hypothetical protein
VNTEYAHAFAILEIIERERISRNMSINQLVIRDPDYENSYVTDAEINVIEIDVGKNWESFSDFAGALREEDNSSHEEAVEFEESIMAEVKHLAKDNPVRQAAENFFQLARDH